MGWFKCNRDCLHCQYNDCYLDDGLYAENKEINRVLRKEPQEMTDRAVMELRKRGYTGSEIADILKIPGVRVYNHIKRAARLMTQPHGT